MTDVAACLATSGNLSSVRYPAADAEDMRARLQGPLQLRRSLAMQGMLDT